MVDPFVIETVELRKTYDGVEDAARAEPAGARRVDLRISRSQRRRQDDGDEGAARHGETDKRRRARLRLRPTHHRTTAWTSAGAPRFVSEDKSLYDAMNVDAMIRFTAPFFPRWRADLEQRYLRTLRAAAARRKVKTLSRGMRTKLALLLAPCRGAGAAHPRRTHLRASTRRSPSRCCRRSSPMSPARR